MAEGIEGVVKDNTGGVIPGVTVVLTNTDTGATRGRYSDDNGFYISQTSRIGNYEVKAELEGFRPVRITGIKLSVGRNLNFPVVMTVSEVTTEVEVRAEVEQVGNHHLPARHRREARSASPTCRSTAATR